MPVLGPISYDFGLGDEGSPPADRRPDHARGGLRHWGLDPHPGLHPGW
jgi:hypothetical protein